MLMLITPRSQRAIEDFLPGDVLFVDADDAKLVFIHVIAPAVIWSLARTVSGAVSTFLLPTNRSSRHHHVSMPYSSNTSVSIRYVVVTSLFPVARYRCYRFDFMYRLVSVIGGVVEHEHVIILRPRASSFMDDIAISLLGKEIVTLDG